MNQDKTFKIAAGIGWYVLFNALLTTTSAAVGALGITAGTFRGLMRGLGFGPDWLTAISITALAILGWLGLLLILFSLRAWSTSIRITKVLIDVFFFGESQNKEESLSANSALLSLFGENGHASNRPLVWRLLSELMTTWSIILFFQFVTSIVSSLFTL
jgi:hypothetical protein